MVKQVITEVLSQILAWLQNLWLICWRILTLYLERRCWWSFQHFEAAVNKPKLLQNPDFSKPFILTTDASNEALGAILSQGDIGDLIVVYASRTLSKAEQNYPTVEKELLAIVLDANILDPFLWEEIYCCYWSSSSRLDFYYEVSNFETSQMAIKTRGIWI